MRSRLLRIGVFPAAVLLCLLCFGTATASPRLADDSGVPALSLQFPGLVSYWQVAEFAGWRDPGGCPASPQSTMARRPACAWNHALPHSPGALFLDDGYLSGPAHEDASLLYGYNALIPRRWSGQIEGEARYSYSKSRHLFSAEADLQIGHIGALALTALRAQASDMRGGIGTIAFGRRIGPLEFSLGRSFASRNYADPGCTGSEVHHADAVRVSAHWPQVGETSAAYISTQSASGANVRLAGIAYSAQPVEGLRIYASWLHPVGTSGNEGIVFGMSWSLGHAPATAVSRQNAAALADAYLRQMMPGRSSLLFLGTTASVGEESANP